MHCRSNTLSLVCKAWQAVEDKTPHPTLELGPEDLSEAFLAEHRRDINRAITVEVTADGGQIGSDSYFEGVPRLLRHLHAWAQRLCVLEVTPPGNKVLGSAGVLPLIGELSQLERLNLWEVHQRRRCCSPSPYPAAEPQGVHFLGLFTTFDRLRQ